MRRRAAALPGTIEQVVYVGTDTTYHVSLPGGLSVRVREQNREGATPRVRTGDAVGLVLPPAAIRVLVQ